MFFQIFAAKGDTGQFFEKWYNFIKTVGFSLTNLQVSKGSLKDFYSKVFFRRMRTDLSVYGIFKGKTTDDNSAAINFP